MFHAAVRILTDFRRILKSIIRRNFMTTLAVLGWQLMIVLTLGLARFFGENFNKPRAIYWVSGAWIVFTLVSLFTSPLIVLQLAVIFMATRIFAPSEKANKPEVVIASASFI